MTLFRIPELSEFGCIAHEEPLLRHVICWFVALKHQARQVVAMNIVGTSATAPS